MIGDSYYTRDNFPHLVCNHGNWDICANADGHCAAIPTPEMAKRGCVATHFGDINYTRSTLGREAVREFLLKFSGSRHGKGDCTI